MLSARALAHFQAIESFHLTRKSQWLWETFHHSLSEKPCHFSCSQFSENSLLDCFSLRKTSLTVQIANSFQPSYAAEAKNHTKHDGLNLHRCQDEKTSWLIGSLGIRWSVFFSLFTILIFVYIVFNSCFTTSIHSLPFVRLVWKQSVTQTSNAHKNFRAYFLANRRIKSQNSIGQHIHCSHLFFLVFFRMKTLSIFPCKKNETNEKNALKTNVWQNTWGERHFFTNTKIVHTVFVIEYVVDTDDGSLERDSPLCVAPYFCRSYFLRHGKLSIGGGDEPNVTYLLHIASHA